MIVGETDLKFEITEKVACFDLDSTLIETKSGKRFPIDEDDWEFFSENVVPKLTELRGDGFCLVIVTNQSGLGGKEDKASAWRRKLEKVTGAIGLPMRVYCGTGHNGYRKPCPGFMNAIRNGVKDGVLDPESFYCGDACGRAGDHSDCDYKFALNSGIRFVTPEELFDGAVGGALPAIVSPPFDEITAGGGVAGADPPFVARNREVVIMVGFPGAGKSSYVDRVLVPLGYERINRDTLKTKEKCIREMKKVLQRDGDQRVVVDNTNPDARSREPFIKLASDHGYSVRAVVLDVSEELAHHNAQWRAYRGGGGAIPEVVYRTYKKNYAKPVVGEGFREVLTVKPQIRVTDPAYRLLYLY